MIRFVSIIIFSFFLIPSLYAQKNISLKKRFKEAAASIKSASNQENIERILLDSLNAQTTTYKVKAEGYNLCAQLQHSLNNSYNTKAYLKQNLDTIKLYNSIFKIYKYSLLSDSFDVEEKFEEKNIRLRKIHRKNLLGGGLFHLKKSLWAEAYKYFDMYLQTSISEQDSAQSRVAYWASVCGMNENNPYHVLEHLPTAMLFSTEKEKSALKEYEARSYLSLEDTVSWLSILEECVELYPEKNYFFLNLMDYYIQHGEIEKGIAKTDSLLRCNSDQAMYWHAKSMFALSADDFENCLTMSEECLKRDTLNVDALYNKGISLLNISANEASAAKRKILFRRALEPFEKLRLLVPHDVVRWAMPLYRIYLNLNMGDKFEEMDSLLEQQNIHLDTNGSSTNHRQDTNNANPLHKHLGTY
jgi:tetratricopeptide (TPR) repeat protein